MQKRFLAPKTRRSGLTLVEILVGLGVLAILLAVAAPSMADLLERRRVIAAAEEVASVLTYAKAETTSTNSVLTVRFDPGTSMSCAAVTTSATGFNNRCKCNQDPALICQGAGAELLRLFQLPADYVTFAADTIDHKWPGTSYQLKFGRMQMDVAALGFHVDVVSKKKKYTLRVEVNTAGRVRVCTPAGDMTGYARCA
ncbi:Tfp pilus assembly protein FimT/FimU [Roseateles sp.]|uniref:pilus assembly FimT family protein n=1 Tax=Roseateles sp. TaxID=1971397 RepID=UPI0025D6BC94|nr:prepilin-type N-terminal cleavage/methylation domain-containing protein [Roseateles sp.]MBV8035690.1 prepilin-type N-terminal cleavage/methylation domain-containing protein [Roseateles sp.]